MRLFIFLSLILLFFSFVLAVDSSLDDDEKEIFLSEFSKGNIDENIVDVLVGSNSFDSKYQSEILKAIGGLEKDKQDSFWKAFWKLPRSKMGEFVNNFDSEKKNDFLNTLSEQYVKNSDRKNPILKINLEGEVEVGFMKTKSGSEYLKLGNKFIFLDKYKSFDKEYPSSTTFDYNSEDDVMTVKGPSNSKEIKGGKYIIGYDSFYLLGEDGKVDRSHDLSGANFYVGNFELDLTKSEAKLKISRAFAGYNGNDPEYSDGGLKTSDGDYLGSLKRSEKQAEVVFDSDGEIKSIMNSEYSPKDGPLFNTEDQKIRCIESVDEFLGEGGKIDSEKIDDFLKEGGEKSLYDGYFVFDVDSGENGKPFVAVISESTGLNKLGEARKDFFKSDSYELVSEILELSSSTDNPVSGGSLLSSLSVEKLGEVEKAIGDFAKKMETSSVSEMTSGEIVASNLVSAILTEPEIELLRNPEFLSEIKGTVGYFKDRLKEDPKYFDYQLGEDPTSEDILQMYKNRNNDLSKVFGLVKKADSVLGGSGPKSSVSLTGSKPIGTLVVGGSVLVENGGMEIVESLDGISFSDDTFAVLGHGPSTSIDKLYGASSDDVWKISENSQGKLEPFLVGSKDPAVKVSSMNINSVLLADDVGWPGWFHDVFSWEENHLTGRVLTPASLSVMVSEDEVKRMNEAGSATDYYSLDGDYEVSLDFHSKVDTSGKSESSRINADAQTKIAESIGDIRSDIKEFNQLIRYGTFEREDLSWEKKALDYFESKKAESGDTGGPLVSQSASGLMTDLVVNMPLENRLQLGVEFGSKGYTSYQSIRTENFKEINRVLDFVDDSLEKAQSRFSGGSVSGDVRAISFIRRGSELFLKNIDGDTFAVNSEVEPYLVKLVPLISSSVIYSKTGNQALDSKNYKFIKKGSMIAPRK